MAQVRKPVDWEGIYLPSEYFTEGGLIHRYLKQLAKSTQIISLHRSAGKPVDWDGNSYTIEELTEKSFGGVDIALFSAGGSISKKYAHVASDAGCTVRPV